MSSADSTTDRIRRSGGVTLETRLTNIEDENRVQTRTMIEIGNKLAVLVSRADTDRKVLYWLVATLATLIIGIAGYAVKALVDPAPKPTHPAPSTVTTPSGYTLPKQSLTKRLQTTAKTPTP